MTCQYDHHGNCQEHSLGPALHDGRCIWGLWEEIGDQGQMLLGNLIVKQYDRDMKQKGATS